MPQPHPDELIEIASKGEGARFEANTEELFDRLETELMTEEQIRDEILKPFFDRVDDAVARGELKNRSGEAYSKEKFADQLAMLQELLTKPHDASEHDVDPLKFVPAYGGLNKAIDEFLSNNYTHHAVLDEIAERYGEKLDLEEVQEVLGETAVETTVEDPDNDEDIDDHAHNYHLEELRRMRELGRMREAARRINEGEQAPRPPSVEEVEEEMGEELKAVRQQINSLIGRLPVAEQGALDRLGEALADRDQEKINAAWVDGISEDTQRDTALIEELTQLYVRKRELELAPKPEQ